MFLHEHTSVPYSFLLQLTRPNLDVAKITEYDEIAQQL